MPVTVIAIYRVQKAREADFQALLARHHPTLVALGLATDEPAVIYRGEEKEGPIVFEIFAWKDDESPSIAHQTPEVMALWEPMGALVEQRDGRPAMQFPHVERQA